MNRRCSSKPRSRAIVRVARHRRPGRRATAKKARARALARPMPSKRAVEAARKAVGLLAQEPPHAHRQGDDHGAGQVASASGSTTSNLPSRRTARPPARLRRPITASGTADPARGDLTGTNSCTRTARVRCSYRCQGASLGVSTRCRAGQGWATPRSEGRLLLGQGVARRAMSVVLERRVGRSN